MKAFTLVFLLLLVSANASEAIQISLHAGTPVEKQGEKVLNDLIKKYDLAPYIITKKINIQSNVIPHSHPVLTLNTAEVNEPDRYLSLFIHEQLHWYFSEVDDAAYEKYMASITARYPKVPPFKEGGARDAKSTYLHFAVCFFEYEGLIKYLGEKRATEVFGSDKIYHWVRKEVIANRGEIAILLKQAGVKGPL